MTTTRTLPPGQSPPTHDPVPVRLSYRQAAPLFDALSSETARAVLTTLAAEPKPTSAVAATVETSTRNAAHHVTALHEAGLLSVVDTWYSEKGREMDVYATRYDPIVLTTGPARDPSGQEDGSTIR